jgi:hypothetical protein
MKPGDLVQVTLRRRGVHGPLPVGILVDIRRREYPLEGERELDYVVVVDGQERHTTRRWLRLVTEEIDNPMEKP